MPTPHLPNRRRCFRFSLRTLFVVVTIAGCGLGWLGWQIQIVRARQAFRPRAICMCAGTPDIIPPPPIIPFYRRWLGDETVHRIELASEADLEMASKLFPEAVFIFVSQGPVFNLNPRRKM